MISSSFDRPERTARTASDARNRYKMRNTTARMDASHLVNTYTQVSGTHRLGSQRHTSQQSQGLGKVTVGDLVANEAALALGDDQAAASQARQMVRHVGSTRAEQIGQFGGVGRPGEESHQDPPPSDVSERRPTPARVSRAPTRSTPTRRSPRPARIVQQSM